MKVFPSLEQVVRRKSCASGAPVPGSPCSTAIHHRRSPEPSSSSSCWTGCGAKCSRPSSRRRTGRASARSGGRCARPARRRRCRRWWRPRRRQTRRINYKFLLYEELLQISPTRFPHYIPLLRREFIGHTTTERLQDGFSPLVWGLAYLNRVGGPNDSPIGASHRIMTPGSSSRFQSEQS